MRRCASSTPTLCEEAGVPVAPSAPADEGRVRRLVLDGAVAARHADQRQAAIERLKEREEDFRARIAEVEGERSSGNAAELEQRRSRVRTRELEAKLSTTTGELRTMHADALRTADGLREDFEKTTHRLGELERELEGAIARVDAFIATPQRAVRKAKRAGEQHVLRPVRRVLGRTKRAASPRPVRSRRRLPPPSRCSRSQRHAERPNGGPRAAIAELEVAAKRMPPPAQRALRHARTAGRRARAQVIARRRGRALAPSRPGPVPHAGRP
ncbi:MAG: hypothetical protein U5K30_01965 [Acidimicrobiales bacterium]|nr:hypothetical protein [Acidimicrobiales bacterium]